MSDTRVKCHPELGILVCTDGHVMVPANGKRKAHWTLGTKNRNGYMRVQIAGKLYSVHRLVLVTFVGPCPEGFECNHKNRDRSDNRLENLEWTTRSDNNRNTAQNDRVDARGGTHWYDDAKQYRREQNARYRAKNKDKERERHAQYREENLDKLRKRDAQYYAENKDKVRKRHARSYQAKRHTHRRVHFADGSYRWFPNEEALELLKIPLKERYL